MVGVQNTVIARAFLDALAAVPYRLEIALTENGITFAGLQSIAYSA